MSADPTADEVRARLERGSRELGLTLTPIQTDQLLAYLGLLQRWNATYNLTAVREPAQMLTHHLLDCLAVVPSIAAHLAAQPQPRIIDVGSGGGLPGVVLAILLPQALVTCVDAVGKKAAFVRQVAAELGLPRLRGVHSRIEQVRERCDLVSSRAFASLADMCRLTAHLLEPQGVWAAMKARSADEEMAALPQDIEVFHVEQLTVPGLDAERCLVWLRRR